MPFGSTTGSRSAIETSRICWLSAGSSVSYEAIRFWCLKFGSEYARSIRRKRGRLGDTWHIDEVFVKIQGQQLYLADYRLLRNRAFADWKEVLCAC